MHGGITHRPELALKRWEAYGDRGVERRKSQESRRGTQEWGGLRELEFFVV